MTEPVEGILERYATESQLGALNHYYKLLLDWNKRVNLTAIVEREEVYVKHFWDSLAVLDLHLLDRPSGSVQRVIDVGTGAGLPGIPLAVCRPDIHVTLCDSLQKRIKFLEVVKQDLKLDNVSIFHTRSEEFARVRGHRNQYDLVMARAVAKLNVLTELLVPFARPGGHVVSYKGPEVSNEVEEAENALSKLGAKVVSAKEISLPRDMGQRTLVVLKVNEPTPEKYPRKAGIPQRQPL